LRRPAIVLLGLLTKMPVAGAMWQTLHYLVGLERLGYEVYYVETPKGTPREFMEHPGDDGAIRAAAFLDGLLGRFGFADRWAYHSFYPRERIFGMDRRRLETLYRDADLVVNLHGGTVPLPEHVRTGRLVYLETDPVRLELGLHDGDEEQIRVAEAHRSFSTWGLNYGSPDCRLPLPAEIEFHRAPPPILLDMWTPRRVQQGDVFTTIATWRQWLDLTFEGESYSWSKHVEFLKFVDLPTRTGQRFELALGWCDDDDLRRLQLAGWGTRPAEEISSDLDTYRRYIGGSRGEFTVAKDQNVRFRTGWFSERSAAYLAAGKPVITQDTGFGSYLPTGEGLFAFSTMEEILSAVDAINSDYRQHSRAASALAREFLDAAVVLPGLLAHFGVDPARPQRSKRPAPLH
jgi:hypothetical protein